MYMDIQRKFLDIYVWERICMDIFMYAYTRSYHEKNKHIQTCMYTQLKMSSDEQNMYGYIYPKRIYMEIKRIDKERYLKERICMRYIYVHIFGYMDMYAQLEVSSDEEESRVHPSPAPATRLQHTATHYNTLQHTLPNATHYITLHTAILQQTCSFSIAAPEPRQRLVFEILKSVFFQKILGCNATSS